MFKCYTTSFHYFSHKDSESLKTLDIQLREVGAKSRLNGTSKVNTQTNRHTNTHTNGHFDLQKVSTQRADALNKIASHYGSFHINPKSYGPHYRFIIFHEKPTKYTNLRTKNLLFWNFCFWHHFLVRFTTLHL